MEGMGGSRGREGKQRHGRGIITSHALCGRRFRGKKTCPFMDLNNMREKIIICILMFTLLLQIRGNMMLRFPRETMAAAVFLISSDNVRKQGE